MAWFGKVLIVFAAVYAAVLVAAYFGQRKLMYVPDRQRTAPQAAGLVGVEELEIAAPDGARLVAWYGRAKPGCPTILYYHGNGGSLVDRAPRIERFMGEGYGVMMLTYRGYGGSTGSPSEVDNVADAKRAFDALVARGVPSDKIVLYGESLGTGVAIQVAAEKPAAGLILDAPYTSMVDVARVHYPYLPAGPFVLDRYESRTNIASVSMPLLILHGARDAIIPVAMGRELARLAPGPKRLVEFPNGGHTNLYIDGNNALDAVRAWIAGLGI